MSDYIDLMNKLRKKADIETKKVYKDILSSYARVYNNYKKELAKVPPGSLREAWIRTQMKSLGTAMKDIAESQEISVKGAMNRVIKESLSMNESYFNNVAKEAGLPDDLFTGMFTSLNTSVLKELLAGKAYKDGGTLSHRVWKRTDEFNDNIENILSDGLTAKKGYYDIAKELEDFVNPSARKDGKYVPGKGTIDYNAYRLANTMITHSYQTALARVNERNPFINGIEWVGGHNARSCKLCKERNGTIYAAKESKGKFTTEPLPLDHPNGFCRNIPYIPDSLDDIGKRLGNWASGGVDPELDEWYDKYGVAYGGAKEVKEATREKLAGKVEEYRNKSVVRDEKWVNKTYKKIKDQVPAEAWEGIKEHLLKAPEFMQDYIKWGVRDFVYGGTDGSRAYYNPSSGRVVMSFNNERSMNTFFHEYGHFLDWRYKRGRKNRLTETHVKKLWKLLNEDYNNAIANHIPEHMKDKGSETMRNNFGKKKLIEALKENKGKDLAGVSDIMGGITLGEVEGYWGHSRDYWLRKDQQLEVVSEAIANMNEALMVPESLAYMEKFFPTALEEYKNIIKKIVSK